MLLYAQYDTIETPPPPAEVIDEGVGIPDSYTEEEELSYFVDKTLYDGVKFGDRKLPGVNIKELEDDEDFWYANAEVKREKGEVTYMPRRNGASVDPGDEEKTERRTERSNRRQPSDGNTGERSETEIPEYRPRKKVSNESWFQALMWIVIIGGFVGAVVWYLVGNNVGLFRKKTKEVDTGADPDDAGMPEDIFAIQYQKEIDKAAANGDYRLAIRLMYLRLLKNLSERNVISYKQDKTNFDYLVEIQPTPYYNEFFKVTRHYEYSWYGKFPVSSEAYSVIRSSFDNFQK